MEDADIRKTLRHHDQQLGSLSGKVDKLEGTLGQHGSILQDIRTALTRHDATKPPSMGQALSVLRDVCVLVGLGVSAIVYVTGAHYGSEMALIRERISSLTAAVSQLRPQPVALPPPPSMPTTWPTTLEPRK